MYKLIAYWTAPKPDQTDASEQEYCDMDIPLAEAIP